MASPKVNVFQTLQVVVISALKTKKNKINNLYFAFISEKNELRGLAIPQNHQGLCSPDWRHPTGRRSLKFSQNIT